MLIDKLKRIKPFILPFFLALIHYFISIKYSKDVIDFSNLQLNLRLKVIFLIIEGSVFVSLFLLYYTVIKVIKNFSKYKKYVYVFSIYLAVLFVFLILVWPGIWRWDDILVAKYAKEFGMVPWQHFLSSVVNIYSLRIIPFASGVTIIQCILISLIVSYIIVNIYEGMKLKKWYFFIILLVPFLLPSVIDNNLYTLRPILYSYAFILLIFLMFEIVTKSKEINLKNSIVLIITFVTVSAYRSETIWFIGVPMLFSLYMLIKNRNKMNVSKKLLYLCIPIITIGLTFGISWTEKKFLGDWSSNNYTITSTVEQIAPLIREANKNEECKDIIEKIDKVINVKMILEQEKNTGIDIYWQGLVRENYTNEEFNEYMKCYAKLCLKFPKIFINQRIDEFIRTSALKKDSLNTISDTSSAYDDLNAENYCTELIDLYGDIQKPINVGLRRNVIRIIEGRKLYDYKKTNIVYHIFYNLIPPILILALSMIYLFFKKKYVLSFITLLILTKTFLVFMTAPISLFIYYFAEYLLGYLYLSVIITKLVLEKIGKKV